MPFILNEDKALKEKLSGLTVSDNTNATRPVPVYFRLPEDEVRAQVFPYITIDLLSLNEATERTHRGYVEFKEGYLPENIDPAPLGKRLKTELPTPYDLVYQITSWSRYAQHDRALLGVLLTRDYLPHHVGYLDVIVSETNKTTRRLDLMGVSKNDVRDSNSKRVFRNIFTIKVSSELFTSQVRAVQEAAKVILMPTLDHNPSPSVYRNVND